MALHRITREEGGILARDTTDAEGGFRFSLPASGAEEFPIYLVTARYRGVLYFGPPLHGPPPHGSDYLVRVHETLDSDGFRAARRTLTVFREGGGLQVLDVVELSNSSDSTLVPADPEAPGWMLRLPDGAFDVTPVGASDAPRIEGGAVRVEAPVPPGGRDLALRYRVPRAPLRLPIDRPLPALEILVETGIRAEPVSGVRAGSPAQLAEEGFARFAATGLDAGASAELRLELSSPRPWGWILAGFGTVLAAVAALLATRPSGPRLRGTPPSA